MLITGKTYDAKSLIKKFDPSARFDRDAKGWIVDPSAARALVETVTPTYSVTDWRKVSALTFDGVSYEQFA